MEGSNELKLCEEEMVNALQMYIEHLMPKANVRVYEVVFEQGFFIIYLEEGD